MAKKPKKTETRAKKKKWFQILAPKIFLEQVLGETYKHDAESMVGKSLTVNLMNLTGDPKKQSVNVTFRVTQVKDSKGITGCVSYKMSSAGVKRLVRRNRARIDDSFVVRTSDGKHVQIKPLILTRFTTNKSVLSAMRKAVREHLQKHMATSTFDSFIKDLVAFKVQSKLREILKKIYPVVACEIRFLKLEDVKKESRMQITEAQEEPAPEAEDKPADEPAAREKAAEPEVKDEKPKEAGPSTEQAANVKKIVEQSA
jgi:small subunit ribosomal protein S3Ae